MNRLYGIETRIPFTLYEADGINLRTDAVYVAGDVTISKDEGTAVNTTNGFVAINGKYYIILTAVEMQAARISLKIVDQDATKLWLDIAPNVETYGNASAQHTYSTYNPISDEVETGQTYQDMISDIRAAVRGNTTDNGTSFKKADGTTNAFTTVIVGGNRTNT